MTSNNYRILDVHAHLGESLSIGKAGTEEDLMRSMDKNGIEKAILSPIPGYSEPYGIKNTIIQNDRIAEAVAKYPDRFPRGLAVLEPRQGDECLGELERSLNELKLRGLMFHNVFHGVSIDHPFMFTIMEEAKKFDPIVLMHTMYFSHLEPPFRLARLAESFPTITFINGHPAQDTTQCPASIEISKKNKNILLDTCLLLDVMQPIEWMVREVGVEGIVFGSDSPYYPNMSIDLTIVERAEISEEDRRKILWDNAAKLFEIQ